nr:MAG TPA: hypothetical protein [Caudoviricetes sp.]
MQKQLTGSNQSARLWLWLRERRERLNRHRAFTGFAHLKTT